MEIFGLEQNTLRGIVLIVLIVAFAGMVAWAWSGERKQTFDDASRLPLEEDEGELPGTEPIRDQVRESKSRENESRKNKSRENKAGKSQAQVGEE